LATPSTLIRRAGEWASYSETLTFCRSSHAAVPNTADLPVRRLRFGSVPTDSACALASRLPILAVPDAARRTTRAPATDDRFPVPLRGFQVDPETRCAHYDGPRDVIAIRFACCEVYYPCFRCHRAVASHETRRWPPERRAAPTVLCGVCGDTMTAGAYRRADHTCPTCGAAFNPGCAAHWDRYFAFGP
jgi:uncharacterized CHY-type Zn-finger protein